MADEQQAGTPPATEQRAQTPEGQATAVQPESAAAQPNANGGAQPGAKQFSQAEVDRIVADRLDRASKANEAKATKAREDAERKAAEQQGEYQKLYEQEKALREQAEADRKALEVSALRRQVADKLGLPAGLVDRLRGETADDIEADAKELIKALPKPAAPNINATGGSANGTAADDDALTAMAVRLGVSPEMFKKNYRSI